MGFVQVQESGQEHGTHLLDGGPHGVALLPKYIVETDRAALELQGRGIHAPFSTAFFDELAQSSRLRNAREVAFHVGHETWYTSLRESFGQHLQGDGFSGTGSSGYQAMAVGHPAYDVDGSLCRVGHIELLFFIHIGCLSMVLCANLGKLIGKLRINFYICIKMVEYHEKRKYFRQVHQSPGVLETPAHSRCRSLCSGLCGLWSGPEICGFG